MFSERLENLIKAALQDGVLTEQEKASIIKRAQAEGEDIDEVDIYIQSLVQKKQQELAKEAQEAETARIVAQKKERETRMASELEEQKQRDSIMRKCPVCGERIPALSNVCPHCQHVITGNEADAKMMELMKKITEASSDMYFHRDKSDFDFRSHDFSSEDEYNELKNNPDIEIHRWTHSRGGYWHYTTEQFYSKITELENLYGELPKVQDFLSEQKRKRMTLCANEILSEIQQNYKLGIERAEKGLNFLISQFGSMPEAQVLISKYQRMLEESKSSLISKLKRLFG